MVGTKAQYSSSNTTTTNSKSSTWLLNWFSQLTKSSSTTNKQESLSTSTVILPWKKDSNKTTATSIVITEPIIQQQQQQQQQQQVEKKASSFGSSTIKINNNMKLPRPSITISEHSDSIRRNSQQTTCSSLNTTSDDQYSYYTRRDSNSTSSVISELWSKAKRHKKHPKFHWPNRYQRGGGDETTTTLKPSSSIQDYYDSSLPSSYRIPKHLKRQSISSSLNDNTPSCSRPNSVIYNSISQPDSPNFAAFLLNNDSIDSYWLNDTQQQNTRWEVKHDLTKLAIDGLFSIPELVTQQKSIEKHILQIGCYDATWAMEVAVKFPKWIVIGLDVNYYHTTRSSNSPRNFKFIKCLDLLQQLSNFPDQTFDFIESRFLVTSYSFDQYQLLLNECIRITKPGGYIEVMEMDLRIYHQRLVSSSVTHLLNNEVIKTMESKQLDPRLARRLQDLIMDREDVTSEIKYISLPLGVWGGKLGVMFRDDVHTLIESFQQDVADHQKDNKKCRTEDELNYKMDIMDNEMDSNRAFMNLHVMLIYV